MWTKIEQLSHVTALKKGMRITQDPHYEKYVFEILQINPTTHYITLMNASGKTEVKFLPADE